jgi:hypothetical protein
MVEISSARAKRTIAIVDEAPKSRLLNELS